MNSFLLPCAFAAILCSVPLFGQEKLSYVPCNEMPALMQEYSADVSAVTRFYTPITGSRGGLGGGEQSFSPERTTRLATLNESYLKRLEKLNFQSLPQECRVDYLLFTRNLKDRLERERADLVIVDGLQKWFPFAGHINQLQAARRRGIQPNAPDVARQWNRAAKDIDSLTGILKGQPELLPAESALGAQYCEELKKAVNGVYSFYNGYDPLFSWWVPKSYEALDAALTGYGKAFSQKAAVGKAVDKSGITGVSVGEEELIRQLKSEMIPYSPAELIAMANDEFAWCDAELLKASKEMGFGNNWKAAQEKVKNTYVEPGKQPEMIYGLYKESIDFLKKHDLITIPPLAEEVWGMSMMSAEAQLTSPFFLGGSSIIVSYPTSTMDYDAKMMSMRGNNPHFSRATVHHELIAGHNLQGFMNSRNRTYRDFQTPFWTEGWALYWELILWDMGFPKGPEDRIGMLFWHMHRCARIIFSLNYHSGKWTPQQCIDFLVDRVGFERANAEGEVRRSFAGRYPPLYQAAYLIGGRQFYALKKELVDTKKMTYKQFHDAVITLNAMPVEMVRAILTNQKVEKNFTTSWRFYGLK